MLFAVVTGVHVQATGAYNRPSLLWIFLPSADDQPSIKERREKNDKREGILNKIDKKIRESGRVKPPIVDTPATSPTILRRYSDGRWQVIETQNARVRYGKNAKLGEEVAKQIELYRKACFDFLKCKASDWTPKVDVYIHDSAEQYTRITHQGPGSPGHSQVGVDRGKITSRRIDLRADAPDVATAILPHELFHVVLAEIYTTTTQATPRWLGEGLAVLQEPPEKAQAHLRNLKNLQQQGKLLSAQQIMTMGDYPPGQQWPMFYGESVALVEFFVAQDGADQLVAFQREAFITGYEPALKKYYKIDSFSDLERQFNSWLAKEL